VTDPGFDAILRDPRFTDVRGGGDEAWLELFVEYWNGPGMWRSMSESLRATFRAVGRKVFFEVMALCRDEIPLAAYPGLAMPVLVARGERTTPGGRRMAELLAGALPQA